MKREISEEIKNKAIKMYRKGEYTNIEICNLLDISNSTLYKITRQHFQDGTLQRKLPSNTERQKFTEDEERQIAIDYYENNLSWSKLKAKWNIHPVQMQRIRNKYKDLYGIKVYGNKNKK